MNRRQFLVGTGAAAAASLLTGAIVRAREADGADRGFNPYLHRTSGRLADPINLLFRGDVAGTSALIQSVLGWYPVIGSPMLFIDDRGSHPTTVQLGYNLPGGSRYHIRLGAVVQFRGANHVLAGVHRDDTKACGHIGVAFDAVRDLVAGGFSAAGYSTERIPLGNTTPGPQCDGSYTAGDGTAILIDLTPPGRLQP